MTLHDPKATARDAAKWFAETHASGPREVGMTESTANGLRFKLVDGLRWYIVRMVAGGWEITAE